MPHLLLVALSAIGLQLTVLTHHALAQDITATKCATRDGRDCEGDGSSSEDVVCGITYTEKTGGGEASAGEAGSGSDSGDEGDGNIGFSWGKKCTDEFNRGYVKGRDNAGRYWTQRRDAAGSWLAESGAKMEKWAADFGDSVSSLFGGGDDDAKGKEEQYRQQLQDYRSELQKGVASQEPIFTGLAGRSAEFEPVYQDIYQKLNNDQDAASKGILEQALSALESSDPGAGSNNHGSHYPFKTPEYSSEGQKLRQTREYSELVKNRLANYQGSDLGYRQEYVAHGDLMLELADEAYDDGQMQTGDSAVKIAQNALDLAAGFVPGVSLAHDLHSIITGENFLTGELVSDVERGLLIGTLVVPSAVSGSAKIMAKVGTMLAKHADQMPVAAKLLHYLSQSDGLFSKLVHNPCTTSLHFRRMAPWKHVIGFFFGTVALAANPCATVGEATGEGLQTARSIGLTNDEFVKHARVIERWDNSYKVNKISSADEVNLELKLNYPEGPYSSGTKVIDFRTTHPEVFYRVHTELRKEGRWLLRKGDIEGLSPMEIREKFALSSMPTHISEAHVPAGTNIRTGHIGKNAFGGDETAVQYELRDVVVGIFKNTKPL
jgi:hypothetical protein